MSSNLNLVKKLSAKTIVGDIMKRFALHEESNPDGSKVKRPKLGEEISLFRVYGIANGVKKVTTTFGDSYAFIGQFEAIRKDTDPESGEITVHTFRGPQCFLPEVATELMRGVVMEHGEDGVKFAIDLGARVVEDRTVPGARKYEFTVRPLVAPAENDALSAFKNELLALEAPKTAADSSAPPAGDTGAQQSPADTKPAKGGKVASK